MLKMWKPYRDPYFPSRDRNVNYDPEIYTGKWDKYVHLFINIVAKGRNLLYDNAPGLNGIWHDRAYALLQEIGVDHKLKWEKVGKGFLVEMPEQFRKTPPCKYVWVIKIDKME